MIHLDQDQELYEDKNLKVASPTGNYEDYDLINCYHSDNPNTLVGSFQAQYVKYGNMIYRFNEPKELGPEILKMDPASTHTAAALVRMTEELFTQAQEGTLTESSLEEVKVEEQSKIDEQSNPIEEENTEDEEETKEEDKEKQELETPSEETPEEILEEEIPEEANLEEDTESEVPTDSPPVEDSEVVPPDTDIIPEPTEIIPEVGEETLPTEGTIVPDVLVPESESVSGESPVSLLRRKKKRKIT